MTDTVAPRPPAPAQQRAPGWSLRRIPLLAWTVAALLAVGLLPVAVTFLQLRDQRDALLEQVQHTHAVAATSTAERVDAAIAPLADLLSTVAARPELADPGSTAAQDLLRSTLRARPDVAALGLFDGAGETLLLGQRIDVEAELGEPLGGPSDHVEKPSIEWLKDRWLRLRRAVDGNQLILLADAERVRNALDPRALGDTARVALLAVDPPRELIGGLGVAGLSDDLAAQARDGRVRTGVRVVRTDDGGDRVAAFSATSLTPWIVVSSQPAEAAEIARHRFRVAARNALALAGSLALLLSAGAFVTVIRPLRRLATAQRELVGGQATGSELGDLESSFARLAQRIRDQEDLGQIFLGRYQVTGLVGSGAMGSVFRGWDEKLQRPVAIKTVHLESAAIDREKLVANLRSEASAAARLQQPHVVTIYDIEEQGESAFIAMELVEGINLQQYLAQRVRLPPAQVVPLVAALARGLASAHALNLVHHDVKPANVLLGRDGAMKLTDFGISQVISASTRDRDILCGTPGYLAPEVFDGDTYAPAADLWALGVIAHECLSGTNPFRGANLRTTVARTMNFEAKPLAGRVDGLPAEFSALVDRLLAKRPQERPTSAEEVASICETLCRRHDFVWRIEIELTSQAEETPRQVDDSTQLLTIHIG
ncbi:MAG: serine/threonine-protein kinase [Acidobacteriota bacterium]